MNWMPIREFLRGGYKTIDGPTVVSNHGRPIFTVLPYRPTQLDASEIQIPVKKPPRKGTST